MKILGIMACCFSLMGCWGNSAIDSELVGQPKKVIHVTPMFCEDRNDLDISLGVMRNGVGSMSTQDVFMTIPNRTDADTLTTAVAEGKVVKIHYDTKRFAWCWNEEVVKSVEVLE